MLSENLKHFRKAKGLSQEELAIKLHIVRQNRFKSVAGLVGSLGTKQNDKSEVVEEGNNKWLK